MQALLAPRSGSPVMKNNNNKDENEKVLLHPVIVERRKQLREFIKHHEKVIHGEK